MRKLMLALIVGLSSATAGCTPQVAPSNAIDLGCLAFRPIYPTKADVGLASRTLKDQINAHNEIGEARCGWKPPGAGKEELAR